MCRDLGGKVEEAQVGEYGAATLTVTDSSGLLKTAQNSTVWMSHRDKVTQLPPDFTTTATTSHCPHAAVACEVGGKKLYGFQFHPEVTHSQVLTQSRK